MKKIAIAAGAAYLIALHAIVTIALFSPQLIEDQRWRFGASPAEEPSYLRALHSYFIAQDRNAADGRIILIGDSHFQRMDHSGLTPPSLNFGAGGDTVRNMIERARDYQSLSRSGAVILWGGFNDLQQRAPAAIGADMERLIAEAGNQAPAFVLSIPPVSLSRWSPALNEQIRETNLLYASLCAGTCTYVDVNSLLSDSDGALAPEFDSGDGLHLNARGYAIVMAALSSVLTAAAQ